MRVAVASSAVELDNELALAAAPRCAFQNFLTERTPTLRLLLGDASGPTSAEFTTAMGAVGRCVAAPGTMTFAPPQDMYVAEAAARIAYQHEARALGGILVHSSSVHFNGRAVMAVGQSGAGKSTLARNLIEAGGTLLSDEITLLLPDGTIYGTPFRSNVQTPGHPGPARIGVLCLIVHAPEERLEPLNPAREVSKILSQVYEPFAGASGATREALACVSSVLSHCGLQAFHCRNHPDAGHFLRRHLESHG